jgi:Zn-dependent peptidase ImmA (M78 family)
MMISPFKKKLIQNRAEYKLNDYGLNKLPIDLPFLVEREDLMLYPKNDYTDGVSGMLVRVGNEYCIVYSTYYHNLGFERFSIAHELGHYFLDDHPQIGDLHRSSAGFICPERYEREADIFASGLLMPEAIFKEKLREYPKGLDGIIGMAELCNTSLTATAIRYAEFTTDPLMVIISTNGIIDFCIVSEKIRHIKDKEIPQKGYPIPQNTATAAIAKTEAYRVNRERRSITADLSDWLELRRSKDALEEAIGLGKYEKVLTVVSV